MTSTSPPPSSPEHAPSMGNYSIPQVAPPTPAPSSPGESMLDGGGFFHEKDYQDRYRELPRANSISTDIGEEEGSLEDLSDEVLASQEEPSSVGEEEGDEEHTDDGEEDGVEGRDERLTEVWPEPKEDGHAFVAGEPGGVRRRRTVGLRGSSRPSTAGSEVDGTPKRRRIRFAPLRIPLRRRLQTLSILWHELAIGLFLTAFWFSLPNPLFWPFLAPYLLHLLVSTSHTTGATPYLRSSFLRSLPIWRYYNAYFPITLHRTVPLDPTKNYIFGYQPHGIIGIGAWGCFATDDGVQGGIEGDGDGYASVPGGGFGRLFPGIRNTLLTLDGTFKIPFYREYLLAMGLASVSRKSCDALLSGKYKDRIPRAYKHQSQNLDTTAGNEEWTWKSTLHYLNPIAWILFFTRLFSSILPPFLPPSLHPYLSRQPCPPGTSPHINTSTVPQGNAITIVLGGAHESLLTLPGHYRIILRRRRGFLKLALCNPNTHLVPVLAFGENDLYETLVPEQGTWLDKLQKGIKRWLGWTVPVFWARGVFNYDVGMVPFRRGIEVVCGRPVVPERWKGGEEAGIGEGGEIKEPTEEEIDQLQEEYVRELMRVWDEWKDIFAPARRGELEIVE